MMTAVYLGEPLPHEVVLNVSILSHQFLREAKFRHSRFLVFFVIHTWRSWFVSERLITLLISSSMFVCVSVCVYVLNVVNKVQ